MQQITGIPPEGLTAEEIEKMRKKFGVSFKFSKFVLNDKTGVSHRIIIQEKKKLLFLNLLIIRVLMKWSNWRDN